MSTTIDYELRFPQRGREEVPQDVECVEVRLDGAWRTVRFHDYADIYALPGLYEQLFAQLLECRSPEVVVAELIAQAPDPAALRVLEIGAGNGMVGERLRELGPAHLVGADILEAAGMAAERDRPGVYDDYFVGDLTALSAAEDQGLADGAFNTLVTVAALGFGDMPPAAFAAAFNHVADGGLIAMNIKDEFLEHGDDSGFAGLIRRAVADDVMHILSTRRYRHRLSVTGGELHYVALVAEKRRALSE